MANSRIARLFMEVAPPQYVTVMRHRTSKMLDTISEEEKESNSNDPISSPKNSSPSLLLSSSSAASTLSSSSASISSATSAASATIVTPNSKYFLKEVHRSLSALNN